MVMPKHLRGLQGNVGISRKNGLLFCGYVVDGIVVGLELFVVGLFVSVAGGHLSIQTEGGGTIRGVVRHSACRLMEVKTMVSF